MTETLETGASVRVVFADANVLYSRVLRDFLLYAANEEIISITWSRAVLDETVVHLVENVDGFTAESGDRLISAMNAAFPYAEFTPTSHDYAQLGELDLPDEDDRHVLAAALAAEATVLCTSNVKDFPDATVEPLGLVVMTPDDLLHTLVDEYPQQMIAVHATTTARLHSATGASTIAALERADAPNTAALLRKILPTASPGTDT